MIKSVVNGHNLKKASRQVVSNRGSAGIDRVSAKSLRDYFIPPEEAMLFIPEGITEMEIRIRKEQTAEFERNRDKIVQAVLSGTYLPQPVRGVEIPKDSGKKRLLGIPTVTDRLLQQAVHQVIYPLFEVEFKSGNYGERR